MPFPVIPVVATVGALGAAGVALRLNQLRKKAGTALPPAAANVPKAPPSPPPVGPVVPASPPALQAVLPLVKTNPDGSPHEPGTPFIFPSNEAAAAAVQQANALGISVQQLVLQQTGQLQQTGDGVAVDGQRAIVTTNDPAPAGDLVVRSTPSATGKQVGGAEKNGVVTILDSSDPVFARIKWNGGNRWPACTGFAKKQFLKLI